MLGKTEPPLKILCCKKKAQELIPEPYCIKTGVYSFFALILFTIVLYSLLSVSGYPFLLHIVIITDYRVILPKLYRIVSLVVYMTVLGG